MFSIFMNYDIIVFVYAAVRVEHEFGPGPGQKVLLMFVNKI